MSGKRTSAIVMTIEKGLRTDTAACLPVGGFLHCLVYAGKLCALVTRRNRIACPQKTRQKPLRVARVPYTPSAVPLWT